MGALCLRNCIGNLHEPRCVLRCSSSPKFSSTLNDTSSLKRRLHCPHVWDPLLSPSKSRTLLGHRLGLSLKNSSPGHSLKLCLPGHRRSLPGDSLRLPGHRLNLSFARVQPEAVIAAMRLGLKSSARFSKHDKVASTAMSKSATAVHSKIYATQTVFASNRIAQTTGCIPQKRATHERERCRTMTHGRAAVATDAAAAAAASVATTTTATTKTTTSIATAGFAGDGRNGHLGSGSPDTWVVKGGVPATCVVEFCPKNTPCNVYP